MRLKVFAVNGVTPVVDPSAFVHPSAVLIGDVIVGARCYVGPDGIAARRFRPDRSARRRQHSGLLRHARLSGNRHRGRGGGPHRARCDSARLCRAP